MFGSLEFGPPTSTPRSKAKWVPNYTPTIPKTHNWHFFVKYLFILDINFFDKFIFNFLEFQQLKRNKYAKYTLCWVFANNNNQMGGMRLQF
jgi:hypothetical protein